MFIVFPPTFEFPSGMPREFLPTHRIFYSQRILDMNDRLPKYEFNKDSQLMARGKE